MSIEFFVSDDDEVENISNFDELFDMMSRYNIIASGANDFKTVRDISNFFLENDDYVPTEAIKPQKFLEDDKTIKVNIYKFDKLFTSSVAEIEHEKLKSPEAIEYWHSRGYFSQGTWNAFFGLHNLCIFAVRDNKDIYIYEEINE